jgi:5-methyltetrahydropteroyltriglutamate--homocysteine methyltransferase
MGSAPNPPFRAEHIGSLVRPPRLLQARARHAEGKLGRDDLRAIEDDAIRGVVALQEEIGLNVVTDGEFRRGTYSDSFTSAGISGVQIELTEDQGWSSSQSHGHRMARRIPKVVDRIAWAGPQNAQDFRFLKSLTARTPKITLPGPCYIHYRAGRANISREVYRDLDAFWSDLVEAYASSATARAHPAQGTRGRLVRPAANLCGSRQRRGCRSAEGDEHRHSHLPQPGSELAGGHGL